MRKILSLRINTLVMTIIAGLTPITALAASLPMKIINNTSIADDSNVYIAIKATNPSTGKQCLVHFDKMSGNGSCEEITPQTHFSDYSYALSDLPQDGNKRQIYLPQVSSGRIYFSIGIPMDMYIDTSNPGNLTIVDPDGFKPRDTNYYTLYDKIEFSYNNNGSWINPTAVDFFSLPIRIQQTGSTSGVTTAGFSQSRADILSKAHDIFNQNDKTQAKIWSNLFLTYQDSDQSANTTLRLIATGKAMVSNVAGTKPFDSNYLSNQQAYGFSYIDFLWTYFKTHKITIDCTELKGNPNSNPQLDNYIFSGQVVGDTLIFTNQTGTASIPMAKPTLSMPFFAGAGLLAGSLEANNTPGAIIVRELTSAFEVGLLPADDGAILSKDYFVAKKQAYYQTNSLLPKTAEGPWYDLYSKALHSFGNTQPIYTFAYDDALGQDGTLHDPSGTAPSAAIVTLGDMSGTQIPVPLEDKAIYTVTAGVGSNSIVKYIVDPNDRSKDMTLKNGQTIPSVKIPFRVQLNDQDVMIYIKHPMVKPFSKDADGIVITQTSPDQVTVAFPGKAAK